MAQKNFRAMAQTLIFWGFEPWLKPTFDMQILTSKVELFCFNRRSSRNSILNKNAFYFFFIFENLILSLSSNVIITNQQVRVIIECCCMHLRLAWRDRGATHTLIHSFIDGSCNSGNGKGLTTKLKWIGIIDHVSNCNKQTRKRSYE